MDSDYIRSIKTRNDRKSHKDHNFITIDWDQFDKLCAIQCSLREIAFFFQVSEDTIENKVKKEKKMLFSEYFDIKRQEGKIALRRKMFNLAMAGDRTMLIFLSKQYLGFTEKWEARAEYITTNETKNTLSLEVAKKSIVNILKEDKSIEAIEVLSEKIAEQKTE